MFDKYGLADLGIKFIYPIYIGNLGMTLIGSKVSKGTDNSIWILPGLYIADNSIREGKTVGIRFLRWNIGVVFYLIPKNEK